jgi:glycosyltransferase involved in cell wall biosynthesis
MSKICFVSYEIHPVTRGGCGVLLYNSALVLLQQGHQVIFILDISVDHFNEFNPNIYPNSYNCKAYRVEELCTDLPLQPEHFSNKNAWRAYRFHWAAQKVAVVEQPHVIEFFDFTGPAHYALSAKVTQSAYKDTQLVVRLHNSYQLTNSNEPPPVPLTIHRYMLFALEHSALRLAEVVLFPSQAFLNEAYKPHYEPWLGQLIHSKPALLNYPKLRASRQEKNNILFYGRLFGRKGVDIFVDAAITLLSEGGYDDLRFVLVGYDSNRGPDGSNTYQEYLLKRIPRRYESQFEFMGQLSWSQLEDLLPQVYFAVIPSYFESFCYAVHELYAAGIPVIVNDIPGLRDYFRHQENALLFDGTMSDLAQQMKALWEDKQLRERFSYPYSLSDNPLGSFYEGPFAPTWIRFGDSLNHRPSIMICILGEDKHASSKTIRSLGIKDSPKVQIIRLTELSDQVDTVLGGLWFLGKLYRAVDADGRQIKTIDLKTAETLLILRAGDLIQKDYVMICLDILARQPELSFVGCWKRIHRNNKVCLDTFPIDTALELIPFANLPLLSRVVMRTEPGRALIDLFDPRLLQMGEVGYLWDLETLQGPGILIPECLIELNENNAATCNTTLLSYLILRDTSKQRKIRLTNYLVTIWSARSDSAIRASQTRFSEKIAITADAIRSSKVGRIMRHLWMARQHLFIVEGARRILRRFGQRAATGL